MEWCKEWCKFCKHGYGVVENGKYSVYCHLSHFGYPTRKQPQDTCGHFEEDIEDDVEEDKK